VPRRELHQQADSSSMELLSLGGGISPFVGGAVDDKDWKTISKMSECTEPVQVKVGDKIKLEAIYDNVAHPL
jgi:hypothetical protein